MKKAGVALLGLLILSGCALPVPLRLASWAIDGFSLLTSQKSITDHAISLLAERDCAIWRGVAGEEVCIDSDAGSSTVVSEAEGPGGADSLAGFETATGPPALEQAAYLPQRVVVWLEEPTIGEIDQAAVSWQTALEENYEPRVADWQEGEGVSEPDPAADSFKALSVELGRHAGVEVSVRPAPSSNITNIFEKNPTNLATAQPAPRRAAARIRADAGAGQLVERATPLGVMSNPGARAPGGVYFVVGSFHSQANARRFAQRHDSLTPMVVSAKIDGGVVFRVLVGPFSLRDRQDGRRRVLRAGIFDAWAINLDTENWRLARIINSPARQVANMAGLVVRR